ncbi:MAG: hypothetical protein V3U84_06725 [Thiotrichaceae bacterium]
MSKNKKCYHCQGPDPAKEDTPKALVPHTVEMYDVFGKWVGRQYGEVCPMEAV